MNPLVLLAKLAAETYIEDKKVIPVPDDFPEEFLSRRSGVFVTIEKEGRLRGCIGTYLPVQDNIGGEIIHNAISAATQDSRFGPVKKTELPHLSYTVYILNKPEKVADIAELDPKKFGIIVKSGIKSGLLLPDLEGVNTVAEQISICCQKGGIYLKEKNIEIYKFTVEKYQ
ncbi:MAG: AmmeMemoRadiSam system protein A [Parcubacteria group bacterium]